MRIYTKTGDDGSTGLLGAAASPRTISASRSTAPSTSSTPRWEWPAPRASMPTPMPWSRGFRTSCSSSARRWPIRYPDGPFHRAITAAHVAGPRIGIDRLEAELEPLTQFILPGGTPAAAPSTWPGPFAGAPNGWPSTLSQQPGEARPRGRHRLPEPAERSPVRAGPRGRITVPAWPTSSGKASE